MKILKLRFGEILVLNKNLAEVIINEGIVMDMDMVNEYHSFLLENFEAPFSLLVNKKYAYTYTFEAQREIANLPEIKSMAVVTHRYLTHMATDFLININSDNNWKIKLYRLREEALDWLEKEM